MYLQLHCTYLFQLYTLDVGWTASLRLSRLWMLVTEPASWFHGITICGKNECWYIFNLGQYGINWIQSQYLGYLRGMYVTGTATRLLTTLYMSTRSEAWWRSSTVDLLWCSSMEVTLVGFGGYMVYSTQNEPHFSVLVQFVYSESLVEDSKEENYIHHLCQICSCFHCFWTTM